MDHPLNLQQNTADTSAQQVGSAIITPGGSAPETVVSSTPDDLNTSSSAPNRAQPTPHRYQSLAGLLHQSGASPAFGVEGDDDASYRHLNMDDGSRGSNIRPDALGGSVRRRCLQYDSPCAILLGLSGIAALGILLGLAALPSSPDGGDASARARLRDIANWDAASSVLGYTYTLSWTLSFYPQIVTNCRRPAEARRGVSLDFVAWNIVGFSCYAAYTTGFRYSATVRREYAERFGDGGSGRATDDGGGTPETARASTGIDFNDRLAEHAGSDFGRRLDWIMGGNSTASENSNSTSGNDEASGEDDNVAVPQVKGNDVAFAWHALILTVITFIQITRCGGQEEGVSLEEDYRGTIEVGTGGEPDLSRRFPDLDEESDFVGERQGETSGGGHLPSDGRRRQLSPGAPSSEGGLARNHWSGRISGTTKCLMFLLVGACVAGAVIVESGVDVWYRGGGGSLQWIDYLYFLSFVKVAVSVVKYIPQVVLNYRRKSTSGWQIWNILLDFSGGTLSIVQLVGDSLAEAKAQGLPHGWTGIIGNPAKLGLGLVSIFFDVIFMLQHYVLYRHASPRHLGSCKGGVILSNDYRTPLLQDQLAPSQD